MTITNVIQKALDSGCEVRMVGLDFSAAFDRVNYEALISKLRQLGLSGAFLSILIEFLTDRVQRVVVGGHLQPHAAFGWSRIGISRNGPPIPSCLSYKTMLYD